MAMVFVSYAREDLPVVEQLEQALAGYDLATLLRGLEAVHTAWSTRKP
jgi:hypothetical protein